MKTTKNIIKCKNLLKEDEHLIKHFIKTKTVCPQCGGIISHKKDDKTNVVCPQCLYINFTLPVKNKKN